MCDLLAVVRWYIADERVLQQIETFHHSLALANDFLAVVKYQNAIFVIPLRGDPVERLHRDALWRR